MALQFFNRYTPDAIAPDANYPYGSFKNETAPGNLDGTPYEKDWPNDVLGILQKLLDYAAIVPSGNADTVVSSQYFQALQAIFEARIVFDDNATGTANDIIILSIGAEPPVYRDGLVAIFKASTTNTGAATLQIDTLAPKSFTTANGNALEAGDISAGKYVVAVFNATNDRFELTIKQVELHGRGEIDGLILENDASDPVNDIFINPGEARSDSNELDMLLQSPLIKQIDATWSEGTNQGGLAAGLALSNIWYHDFLLGTPDGAKFDFGFDSSPVAANLLADPAVIAAGYSEFRRIGSTRRIAGANLLFSQIEDWFVWRSPYYSFSGALGTVAQLITMMTPPDFNFEVFFNLIISHASTARLVYVSAPFQTNQLPTGLGGDSPGFSERIATGYLTTGGQQKTWTDESSRLRIISNGSNTIIDLNTIAYKDLRGKDSI